MSEVIAGAEACQRSARYPPLYIDWRRELASEPDELNCFLEHSTFCL